MTQMHFRTLPELLTMLENANSPEEVFGRINTQRELQAAYRKLAIASHPDHHPYFTEVAEEAFKLLQAWHELAKAAIEPHLFELQSRQYRYQSEAMVVQGDLSDVYSAKAVALGNRPNYPHTLLKIVRQPRNNDLISAEARALKRINRELDGMPLRPHFPTLIESFVSKDANGTHRHVNAIVEELGTVTLADVIEAYPNGIDAADMAWMFNRLLSALSETHSMGLVHGAVFPEHVLIRPKDHNGILIDWCYSVEIGEHIKALSPPNRKAAAPEMLGKLTAGPETDIYMAALTMVRVLGGKVANRSIPSSVPKPISKFLSACLINSRRYRPNNAWELFEEFGEILFNLYGPPSFRPFSMPIG